MWEVGDKVGHGTYSEIYGGTHLVTRARCALKVDRPGPHHALAWESAILARLQKYPVVARHYGLL